jgi:DNA-binding transcriptional MerR regulator
MPEHDIDGSPTLTISEFGRRSGLSHKALRLYDMSGLLRPAVVDRVTGYRIYSVDQLDRARRISLLRQLDMPLATVAHVLSGTDEQTAYRLDVWWAEQEATIRAKRGSLAYLRAKLTRAGADDPPRYPVSTRVVRPTKIATITRDVDQQGLVPMLIRSRGDIEAYLLASGAVPTGEHWAIFHGFVTPDSEAPVEVCMPFTGTVDPTVDIAIRIEPEHIEAYCTVSRDNTFYPQILVAYDVVHDWVTHAGRTPTGSPREIYFTDWCAVEGSDPFVHIAQPVAPTDDESAVSVTPEGMP